VGKPVSEFAAGGVVVLSVLSLVLWAAAVWPS
jgi:hypothetical protein